MTRKSRPGAAPAEAVHNTLTNVGQSVGQRGGGYNRGFFRHRIYGSTGLLGTGDRRRHRNPLRADSILLCASGAWWRIFRQNRNPIRWPTLRNRSFCAAHLDRCYDSPRLWWSPSLSLLLLAATQIPKLRFDYNLNNLLAVNSEAVRVGELLESQTPVQDAIYLGGLR